MRRRDALILRAFAGWTVWVWAVRLWNIWGDDHSVGFKLVHSVLAVVSVVFAVVAWRVVTRARAATS